MNLVNCEGMNGVRKGRKQNIVRKVRKEMNELVQKKNE
jgi:hypothetical protein